MSRSYRHTPILKDGSKKGNKWAKGQANRKVRRAHEPIANGKAYRKLYNSWNINDYICYWPLSDGLRWYRNGYYTWFKDHPTTEKEYIDRWWKPVYYWK